MAMRSAHGHCRIKWVAPACRHRPFFLDLPRARTNGIRFAERWRRGQTHTLLKSDLAAEHPLHTQRPGLRGVDSDARGPLPTFAESTGLVAVLALVEQPSFPGCLLHVRPVGMLDMLEEVKHATRF
jgi:hypothetical protein